MSSSATSSAQKPTAPEAEVLLQRDATASGVLRIALKGRWSIRASVPGFEEVVGALGAPDKPQKIAFDSTGLTGWDSRLLTLLVRAMEVAKERGVEVDTAGLPEGLQRLLSLTFAVPEKDTSKDTKQPSFVAVVGEKTIANFVAAKDAVTFVGEAVLALGKMVRGKASYRRVDFFEAIQKCGAEALGIVSLISFLVGLILAFVGAIQLQKFGAEIYVADLVGIAMAREMGAIMTGIVMAGRTGAAFAAQLGTMTVNEEIDALRTMAIPPMEFLVLPRMIALALMMPLLCLYSNLLGILGGAVVSVGLLGISLTQYMQETQAAVTLTHCAVGLTKAVVFGVLVALAGCLRGMQCGRSASAVGEATTSAVVTAIVWIIVTDAVFAVLTNILNV